MKVEVEIDEKQLEKALKTQKNLTRYQLEYLVKQKVEEKIFKIVAKKLKDFPDFNTQIEEILENMDFNKVIKDSIRSHLSTKDYDY